MTTAKATPPIRTGQRQRVGQAMTVSAVASPVAVVVWPLGKAYIKVCASVGRRPLASDDLLEERVEEQRSDEAEAEVDGLHHPAATGSSTAATSAAGTSTHQVPSVANPSAMAVNGCRRCAAQQSVRRTSRSRTPRCGRAPPGGEHGQATAAVRSSRRCRRSVALTFSSRHR